MEKNRPIGVFDSGLGGISVLRELVKLLPRERFLYYGDTANAPYGSRPTREIQELSLAAAEYLLGQGCKALVIACNTATAAAIELLRQTYPDTIIVGIEPALKLACQRHKGGTVAVLATELTLREQKFTRLMESCSRECTVIALPSPGLMDFVEQDRVGDEDCMAMLHRELDPWRGKLDAVVLGCTHYPFLAGCIRQVLGEGPELVDGGEGTARETLRRLRERDLCSDGPGGVTLESSLATAENLSRMARLLEE